MERIRVDRWLGAARIFKSRSQAALACNGGHVKLEGESLRPNALIEPGLRLEVRRGERLLVLEIVGLAEKRLSPALARELYVDHSPPPPPRDAGMARRDRGAGRPSKRERRSLRKLRGRD